MATTAATPSRITSITRAFPLVAFFVLAYALSWLILVPAGFGLLPDSASVLAWLAPFGPAVAAFVVTALTGGRSSVGQLLRRLVQWRGGLSSSPPVSFCVPSPRPLGGSCPCCSWPIFGVRTNSGGAFSHHRPPGLC